MQNTFIIAEIGVNHNGNIDTAIKLIDIAQKSGANAVKFQTFNSDKLVTKDASKAKYQIDNTNSNDSQYNMLKKLELSFDQYIIIKKYCDKLNIEFISTPFDIDSVDFLNKLNVNRFKIGSGDLTNYQLLKSIALTNKPIILSTGMSNLNEVEKSINYLKKYTNADITVLHCISSYPTALEDCNLLAIKTMANKLNLPIGFSDHTLGYEAAIIAITLGAKCIEKHFTIDKNMEGPDHKASLSPEELKLYVKKIRETEIMLGDGVKQCKISEIDTRNLVRRSVAINKNMSENDIIQENDIICLRPESGISAIHFEDIIGKKINKNIKKYSILSLEDFY